MIESYVFCDGSYNSKLKIGVGAILHFSSSEWKEIKDGEVFPIRTRVMKSSSIAQIELMTVLWALSDPSLVKGVTLFTDCKMIEGLTERRMKLEGCHYLSGRTGLPLANANLYKQFFKIYDRIYPSIIWVKGHTPTSEQTNIQRVFSLVDKKARRAMRELVL